MQKWLKRLEHGSRTCVDSPPRFFPIIAYGQPLSVKGRFANIMDVGFSELVSEGVLTSVVGRRGLIAPLLKLPNGGFFEKV
ncbi:MAG: hypothetical protein NZ954_01375 [Thermofilaceae archaeon]|nr:hypothetical protein [Thermofilaceae archaeon]MCX8180479.1 hypothetical protein [Thermofilaceae archaeon]MDW8003324.1 hypothetical protein [Thermofilaceae archaeon]